MNLTVRLLHVCNHKNTYKVLFVNIRAKGDSTLVIVGTLSSSMTWTHFEDHLTEEQEEKERSEKFLCFF